MFKKIPLRWRLTLLSSLLIAVCCIGLSTVLSFSAYRMADTIDAAVLQPAQSVKLEETDVVVIPPMVSGAAETVGRAKHSYRMESLTYTMIAMMFGGILTYHIAGKILKPVKVLSEQVKNITAHNLNESLDVPPTKDELAELTVSFNEMTDKLAQTFETQKRFSAEAAHELRTPLAVLQTKLDVFHKKTVHTPEEYEALTLIFQKQVSRLRNIVAELLDIANMEYVLRRQEISLQVLLDDVISELSEKAEKKQIVLF